MLVIAAVTGGLVFAVLFVVFLGCALDVGDFRPHVDWYRDHGEAPAPAAPETVRVSAFTPAPRRPQVEPEQIVHTITALPVAERPDSDPLGDLAASVEPPPVDLDRLLTEEDDQ